ncbi:SAM-dependent methyltransferase, partial [Candidatus Thorarchaeota archaeon]
MEEFKRYYETNKKMWDKFAVEHFDSPQYKMKEFLQGESTLHSIELEELGDVEGKTLLHLQCHFGLDTLSWAREGAIVTGVDFSGEAIQMARHLAQKTGIDGEFIQA